MENNDSFENQENPMSIENSINSESSFNESSVTNDKVNFQNRIDLKPLSEAVSKIREQLSKVIVGQEKMIDQLLVAILANGHVLIEGVPGVAKTITAKLLARTISVGFSRIQFTPDLMPSDILGTTVVDLKSNEFSFKKGPIFSNLVLIDEINRAPAKTQAALFEVMEERQITMDGTRYELPPPFTVIATQNPIEQEGTYRLPEAQLDRFLFKIVIDYPELSDEIAIIQREHNLVSTKLELIDQVLSGNDIIQFQKLVRQIHVEADILEYIAKIVVGTRENPFLYLGASPRASISILNAAKGFAALRGRDFVTPDDVRDVAVSVLHHRIIVAPEREMEGLSAGAIINQIIEQVEIPR